MVSVIVPTYQHAPFIAKCLDGILSQHCPWPIEILIGEDGSTDGTREICQRYAEDHPDKIKLFLRDRKDVMYILGKPTGRRNLLKLLDSAKGRYIALCEGDDQWIDTQKLRAQVDALEMDAEASGCFTDAFNELDGIRKPYMDAGYATSPKEAVGLQKILQGQGIPTCTMLFRNFDLHPVRGILEEAPVADSILFTHLCTRGHLIYLPQRTAVRVMHPGGIHSLSTPQNKLKVELLTLPFLDIVSGLKFSHILEERRRKILIKAWATAVSTSDRILGRYVWPKIAAARKTFGWNLTTALRNFCWAYLPIGDHIRGRSGRRE